MPSEPLPTFFYRRSLELRSGVRSYIVYAVLPSNGKPDPVPRAGKGDKDRRTPLAERCVRPLHDWIERQQGRFARDRRAGVAPTGPVVVRGVWYPQLNLHG